MPLWAPFLLMIGSYWMARHLERRAINTLPSPDEETSTSIELPGTSQFIALISLATIILIWLRFYSQTNFLLDPRWLFALLSDILFLDLRAWQTIFLVALSLYLCWRGVRLSRRSIDPSHINFSLCLGLAIILFVILIRAVQESAGVVFDDDRSRPNNRSIRNPGMNNGNPCTQVATVADIRFAPRQAPGAILIIAQRMGPDLRVSSTDRAVFTDHECSAAVKIMMARNDRSPADPDG